MSKSLTELSAGESGRISDIQGGLGVIKRLESMGLRPGKMIQKVSAQVLRGPVTILVDRRQMALGFGVASKIMIEVKNN